MLEKKKKREQPPPQTACSPFCRLAKAAQVSAAITDRGAWSPQATTELIPHISAKLGLFSHNIPIMYSLRFFLAGF